MNNKNDSNGTQLLKDIVNYENIPRRIVDFWSSLTGLEKKDEENSKPEKKGKKSKKGKKGKNTQQEVEERTIKQMEVVSVLNKMLEMNRPSNVDLMAWYEIFRDIFIMRARNAEKPKESPKTTHFTTFDLSFEQLAFLPEYWFNRTGKTTKRLEKELIDRNKRLATWDKKYEEEGMAPEVREKLLIKQDNPPLPSDPSQLLFSFERFMYDQDGGGCWCAIDWGLPKYCFRVVCDKKNDAPLLNVASLLLTGQSIASGKMGLYVGEKTDMKFSYAEIPGNKLLKYYHFDRFSGLSFIRKHEVDPKRDADAASLNAKFENSWQYLGMMTEFILQNNSARATPTTCSRVSLNTFIRALNTLSGINALGKVPVNRQRVDALVLAMIDASFNSKEIEKSEKKALYRSISKEIDNISNPDDSKIQLLKDINNAINLLDAPAKLVEESPETLMGEIGVEGVELIQPDFYLKYQGLDTAARFWKKAEEVFDEIEKEYKLIDTQTVKRFTLDDLSKRIQALPTARDCDDLKQRLLNAQQNQTRASMRGDRLLAALKPLLIPKPGETIEPEFTINCAQLARILDCSFDESTLTLHPKNPKESKTGDICELSVESLTFDFDSSQKAEGLRRYFLEILTALTRDKKGESKMDFAEDEDCSLKKAQEESGRLWSLFFDKKNEAVLLDRWMLSLKDSIALLENEKAKSLPGVILPNGKEVLLPSGEERDNLLKADKAELEELKSLVSKGKNGKNVEIGKVYGSFPDNLCYSFDDISSVTCKYLVFIDLIARAMVATAVSPQMSSMWDKKTEKSILLLKSFFVHLLYAVPKKKKQKPLRFHLSFDLIGLNARERSKFDQGDYFNRLLGKHEFANVGDRYLLLLMLVDHLREEANPKAVLQTLIDNPSIAEFVGKKRLEQLSDYL